MSLIFNARREKREREREREEEEERRTGRRIRLHHTRRREQCLYGSDEILSSSWCFSNSISRAYVHICMYACVCVCACMCVSHLEQTSVLTKYKSAAEIANKALAYVASLCVPDARVYDICVAGDTFLEEQCAGVYAKSKPAVEKGIAFPTCVSANECVCHCSPASADAGLTLSEGDLVKIDLGCHIDGWIAVCAHSLRVGGGEVRTRHNTYHHNTPQTILYYVCASLSLSLCSFVCPFRTSKSHMPPLQREHHQRGGT